MCDDGMCDDVICDPDDISQGGDDGCAGCLRELLGVFPLYTILGFLLACFYMMLVFPTDQTNVPLFMRFVHLVAVFSLVGLYFTRHIYAWLWKQIAKLIDGT